MLTHLRGDDRPSAHRILHGWLHLLHMFHPQSVIRGSSSSFINSPFVGFTEEDANSEDQ